jgi:hypothetical protein
MTVDPLQQADGTDALHERRVRRFSILMTLTLIVVCNAVILLGLWASGLRVENLLGTDEFFSPKRDVCLRYMWQKVAGVQQPVQLCYEWINLSDPSGNTHTLPHDIEVVLGGDGKLHYARGQAMDPRLLLLLAFVASVLAGGIALSKALTAWYAARLERIQRATRL